MPLTHPRQKFTINVVGSLVTMVVSVVVVPFYIRAIGTERYAMLALIWATFGMLGFMDLGMSRASTNALARVDRMHSREIGEIFGTALISSLVLGCIGGMVIYLLSGWYIGTVHILSETVRAEVKAMTWCISAMFPLTLATGVATGAFDAHERFLVSNVVQVLSIVSMQVLPLAFAIFVTPKLTVILPVLLGARLVTSAATFIYVISDQGGWSIIRVSRARVGALFTFGGWLTVTNIVSPIMTSIDQFLITSRLGAKFTTYYTVPSNVSGKMQFFSATMVRTFFPSFSRMARQEALEVLAKSTLSLSFLSALIFAPVLVGSELFFRLWLGNELAAHVLPVARILIVGAWINGLAYMPYGFCQGQGRPDLVAKVHLCEVVPYLVCLLLLMREYGIVGAALAWAIRATADLVALWWLAGMPMRRLWSLAPSTCVVCLGLLGAIVLKGMLLVQFLAALGIGLAVLQLWRMCDPALSRMVQERFARLGAAGR